MLLHIRQQYGPVAKFFHWVIFLLVVGQLTLASIMVAVEKGPGKTALYNWHKSFGITVFVLVSLRLLWRFINPPPNPLLGTPPWEILLSKAVHFMLYVLLFLMPLSGYVMSMAGGHGIHLFDWFDLPNWIGVNKPLGKAANEFHDRAGGVLLILILLHAGAALFHHYFLKDEVLRRMLPQHNR